MREIRIADLEKYIEDQHLSEFIIDSENFVEDTSVGIKYLMRFNTVKIHIFSRSLLLSNTNGSLSITAIKRILLEKIIIGTSIRVLTETGKDIMILCR